MDTRIFIALLNPSIAIVLAAAFFILWSQPRGQRYMVILALGYLGTCVGFLLQRFELPIGFYQTKFLSNLGFTASGFLIAAAISRRYGRPVPYLALAVLSIGGMAALTWFMVFEPDLTWRVLSMNFALGGVCLVVAAEVRAVRDKSAIDNVIFVASILTALNFFVRTILAVAMQGGFENYDGFYSSVYWTSALLTHAVLSVVVALVLIMAAATDVMRELRTESHTDPLSGLLNRRGFADRTRLPILAARSGAMPLCLIVADLDHFKAVNDAHGHAVGDMVIAAFGRLLRGAGGGEAIVGRTGGEEFAMLIPNCELATGHVIAEGVRTALSVGGLGDVPAKVGRVTASFGVACLAGDEDFEALFRRADDALYQAKRGGRDRVRMPAGEATGTNVSVLVRNGNGSGHEAVGGELLRREII